MGEEFIQSNNSNYIIIRPSVVYGEEDNFINQFGKMAKILPFLPLYKKGERALRDIRLKNLGKKSEKELKHKVTSK